MAARHKTTTLGQLRNHAKILLLFANTYHIVRCNKTKTGATLTSEHKKSGLAGMTLAAVGIVYGDIGTSPLYTLKTVFDPAHGLALSHENLLGIVSLIFWGLTLIVSLKYVTLVLRADNRGEGGIMALMALVLSSVSRLSRWHFPLMVIGVFGATLFYGDSVITPAISVLSAIEGLEVATPALSAYVVPLTMVVLVALYSVQAHGTAGIGRYFAPIMVLWFAALTQWVLNQSVTEGQTVTIPDTDKDFTLNLLTGGASLNAVNVVLPGNSAGRVGQRGFVNCDGQVANVNFSSAIQINNSDVMFSPGDNYVYYRNQPNIWSRVTS